MAPFSEYKNVIDNQAGGKGSGKKEEPIGRRAALKKIAKFIVGASTAAGFNMARNRRPGKEEGGLSVDDRQAIEPLEPLAINPEEGVKQPDAEHEAEGLFEKRVLQPVMLAREKIRKTEIWQGEILDKALVHALELAESRKDQKRTSSRGAQGIRQIMPDTASEVLRYLAKVQRNYDIGYRGLSEKELDGALKEELAARLSEDREFNRAVGDIYLNYLADPVWGEKIGRRQLLSGQVREAQQYVLAAYNMGPGNFKRLKWSQWPRETKEYPGKVFFFKKKLLNAQSFFARQGREIKDFDLLGKIVLEQEKYKFSKDKQVLGEYLKYLAGSDDAENTENTAKEKAAKIKEAQGKDLTG